MAEKMKGISPQTNLPYTTGCNYGRYLRGYEQRYDLNQLNEKAARDHAWMMADSRTDSDQAEFVRGFLDGYALEGRQTQTNGG